MKGRTALRSSTMQHGWVHNTNCTILAKAGGGACYNVGPKHEDGLARTPERLWHKLRGCELVMHENKGTPWADIQTRVPILTKQSAVIHTPVAPHTGYDALRMKSGFACGVLRNWMRL
eukprot:scaffold143060_cov39-Prasinocladus_malaysianus.AAC.1